MSQQNCKLFEDPRITYPAEIIEQDFQRYLSECKAIIENNRVDLANNPAAPKIIEANCPFELNPTQSRAGVLLLHGLYDSPFVLRDIARHLQKQGLKSRSVLLPGHGTVPGALLNVRYSEWLQTAEYALKGLAKTSDKIWIVGFSTGGTIAMYHALKKTIANLAGIVILAPAIQISSLSAYTNFFIKLHLPWYHKGPQLDYTKYDSFTFNSIYQLYLLIQEIKKLNQSADKFPCPLLMVISKDDQTVSSAGSIDYFQRYATADSKMILYSNDKEKTNGRMTTRPATYTQWNIRNISHIAIPIAPDNHHYGIHGDYIYASQVEKNLLEGGKKIYGTYNDYQYQIQNYLHKLGIFQYQYQRLTFNPDFDFLQQSISKFIVNTD